MGAHTNLCNLLFAFVFCISVLTTSYGQVGIGTTAPESALHIVDSLNTEVRISAIGAGVKLRLDAPTIPQIEFFSGGEEKATFKWQNNQLKIFSSPPDTAYILGNPVLIEYPTINFSEDKYVGIQMGLLGEPDEALHVNGRIKMGGGTDSTGVMRYNSSANRFEGFNGATWQPFGGGSLIDADTDTYIQLAEAATDSVKFIANTDGVMAFDGHRLTLGKNGNTYVGHEVTPFDFTSNIGNTNIGWLSAKFMEAGVSNTNVGFWTGHNSYSGDWNTHIGAYAGYSNKSGSSNTMLGYRAGYKNEADGNVFLGHRAGHDELGDNKLYIDNSDTDSPLIFGDFDDNILVFNGEANVMQSLSVFGQSFLQGNVNITGNATMTGATTTANVKVDGSNPFIDFKQVGVSKYYMQYNSSNDRFDVVETGTGVVFRIKDGEIYLPELAGSEAILKVDASGKLTKVEEPAVYRAGLYDLVHGEAIYYIDDEFAYIPMDNRVDDGVTIASLKVRGRQALSPPLDQDLTVSFSRRSKIDFSADVIFSMTIPAGDLSSTIQEFITTTVVTSGANTLDVDNYMYFVVVPQTQAINFVSIRLEE